MGANRFDLALVSMGCSAALESGAGLVRTLRLLSHGEMCIFVGGAIPVEDAALLKETGADSKETPKEYRPVAVERGRS